MQSFFITSSGTDVGKTFVAALLARQLGKRGFTVELLKPVITGFAIGDANCDSAVLLESLGQPAQAERIAAISPWRFADPISPDMAARRARRPIDFEQLVRFSRTSPLSDTLLDKGGTPDFHFVEGIGGVMVPLTDEKTGLDWIGALGYRALLVVGSYLGSLNHSLTSALALAREGVEITAVIVNQSTHQPVPLEETVQTLRRFLPGTAVCALPRLAGGLADWQAAPDLTPLFLNTPQADQAGSSQKERRQ